MTPLFSRFAGVCFSVFVLAWGGVLDANAQAEDAAAGDAMHQAIERAVAAVKPGLVRIQVVSRDFHDGREVKFQSSGSGAIISPDGYVITNHHVAGDSKSLVCTMSSREEIDAEYVGGDPLSDIAVIKLKPEAPRTFPTVAFGDSSAVRVGDRVLAMGSPLSLSQSVTLGIVSNTEMIMPRWLGPFGRVEQDGEDVGSLVRWIAHDAQIFGGNSGGPLVDLEGRIIGVNEISFGLGGAIPGNLAKDVSAALIKEGRVRRAWLGFTVQPLLKSSDLEEGALITGAVDDSPAAEAGMESGDILLELAGEPVTVRFHEDMPIFNQFVADLPIGEETTARVLRGGESLSLTLTPVIREKALPEQVELKEWGITVRDITSLMAREMKRPSSDGVLVTGVRAGGPAGDAKPNLNSRDIIVQVGDHEIRTVDDLRTATADVLGDSKEPVPVLTTFERKRSSLVTLVRVGLRELNDPGLEVKKAWLPADTQVITRDIASALGEPDMTGFRVTKVFEGSTAEAGGLKIGDCITAVDGEPLRASAPEHYEELTALIRNYRVGTTATFSVWRSGESVEVPVELIRAPMLEREMKKYRDEVFEFTVRDVTFFDKSEEKWSEEQRGVYVEEVTSGGWASLASLYVGDLLVDVNGSAVVDVESARETMEALQAARPDAVVLKVVRGIYTLYLEMEPKWDAIQ